MNITQPIYHIDFCNTIALRGQCGYAVNGNQIVINVDEIANDRDEFNVSGTLSLELWALDHVYQGGDFYGYCMAGTELGVVNGQYCLRNSHRELEFQPPPAGTWTLVLMLREWENGSFVTRDYLNFFEPYTVQEFRPAVTLPEGGNVIEVRFRETNQQSATPPVTLEEPKVRPPNAEPQPAATPDPAPVKARAKNKAKPEPKPVSINRASQSELAAVKGISRKVAEAIVENRPYRRLDELLEVKGLGKKAIAKLEGRITL